MGSVHDDIWIWAAHNKTSVLSSTLQGALDTLAVNLRRTVLKLSPENLRFLRVSHRLIYRPEISLSVAGNQLYY